MVKRKDLVVVALATFCLTVTLFLMIPTRSQTPSDLYDPWVDINDDGAINILDSIILSNHFLASGTPMHKTAVLYDSGWVNITDKQGQNIFITHDLNISDWNDEKIMVDITGKTTLDGGLHRYLGLYPAYFSKAYGGTNNDGAYALVQTADGGYALAGWTYSYGAGLEDVWLVKTDASGNAQWNMTYGGTNYDEAETLVQTVDGGYALAGSTRSYGVGGSDFWLVKTDSAGNAQWNKTYGGTNNDWARALVQTVDGGYALAGTTYSYGAGLEDVWLVKTDASGNAQWNMTYGGTNYDEAETLVQTSDDGYALAGTTLSYGDGTYDFWLVKTDSAGNAQWNKTYAGTNHEKAYALVQTADGGYALAGDTTPSFPNISYDVWLVKTDSAGNAQWNKTYGGTNNDRAYALVQTADSGYALAGGTNSYGTGGDSWLVKTDSAGNAQWNKTYGGTNYDNAYALVQTVDGGYALAGPTDSYGAGAPNAWLMKTDAYGDFSESEHGLVWIDSATNTITLHRGAQDQYWNYVRVRILKAKG